MLANTDLNKIANYPIQNYSKLSTNDSEVETYSSRNIYLNSVLNSIFTNAGNILVTESLI